jgi:hypothetical protein
MLHTIEHPKVGKIDLEELREFVWESKKQTWAADGKYEEAPRQGRRYTFQKGIFSYQDEYRGKHQFIGEEIVSVGDIPIWGMNYSNFIPNFPGGKNSPDFNLRMEEVSRILKRAILAAPIELPFRGPTLFDMANLHYIHIANILVPSITDIKRFSGRERVFLDRRSEDFHKEERGTWEIHNLNYRGGLIL